MDWTVLGTVIGAIAACVSAWVAWKDYRQEKEKRRDEAERQQLMKSLPSEVAADYKKLRKFLAAKKWEAADKETWRIMCRVVNAKEEEYLYSEDIKKFPAKHLRAIDQLWVQYSEGHFGFSVQKRIYESLGKDYDKFAEKVEWKKWDKLLDASEIIFHRYAPEGHLPVVDQRLIGVGSLLSREDF